MAPPADPENPIEVPFMLAVDSPAVTTSGVDVNDFTGGFQPIPAPPGLPDLPMPDPEAEFFKAFCDASHPPGTPGCRPEGGTWAGDLTQDVHAAVDQARVHNEAFPGDGSHGAFVALRFKNGFVRQPHLF